MSTQINELTARELVLEKHTTASAIPSDQWGFLITASKSTVEFVCPECGSRHIKPTDTVSTVVLGSADTEEDAWHNAAVKLGLLLKQS